MPKTGTEIYDVIDTLAGSKREKAIHDIFLENPNGAIPNIIKFIPITVSDDKGNTLEYYVMSDYFSLGTNEDYLRLPIFPTMAQKIANQMGYILPTRKIVNTVWKQGTHKLTPKPIVPKPGESPRWSTIRYRQSNRMIEEQLKDKDKSKLIVGHKKDVVISNQILTVKKRVVAIYGWHQPDTGKPIQGLTIVHDYNYTDYSQCVRFVKLQCKLNGKDANMKDLLKNKDLCHLISDEGVLRITEYNTAD